MRFLILLLLLTNNSFSKECLFSHKSKKTNLTWTAYKTQKKLAVSGTFKDFKFTSFKNSTVEGLLSSASFIIAAESVDTKNAVRDKTIASFFFSTLSNGPFIKGQIISVKKDKAILSLAINGVQREVPVSYHMTGKELEIQGQIDILDFSMQSQLKALGKACQSQHEGKTWSTVDFKAKVALSKKC